ncbi:Taf4 family protein [Megaselia abdita]
MMNNSNNQATVTANNRIFTTNQGLQNGTIQTQTMTGGSQIIQGVSTAQLPTTTTIKSITNPVHQQLQSHHAQAHQTVGSATTQTLVIKNQSVSVSLPAGIVTSSAPGMVSVNKTIHQGNPNNLLTTSTMLPSGVVVGMRQANQASQQQNRPGTGQMSRVVIGGSHMVGSRPSSPSITLGSLNQQTAPALIVKTDNGYQLLRVGPPGSGGQPISTNAGNQTIRLQTVPAVSKFTGPQIALRKTIVSNSSSTSQTPISTSHSTHKQQLQQHQFSSPSANSNISKQKQSLIGTTIKVKSISSTSNNNIVVNTVNSTNSTQLFSTQPTTIASVSSANHHQSQGTQLHQTQINQIQSTQTQQHQNVAVPPSTVVTASNTQGNTKEKCRKFLGNLIELSTREPKSVEKSVRTLIQDLINATVEPEQFCNKLEQLLNASPQPCLIGFLKKSLPLLRHSLYTKELIIEGIKPPPADVIGLISSATITQQPSIPKIQAQIRPVNQQIQQTTTIGQTQVRMITSNVQRPIGQTTITKQISGGVRIQQNSCQSISTAPRLLNTQVQRTAISQNTQPYTIQNQTSSAIQKNLQIVKNNVTHGIRSSGTTIIRPPNPNIKNSQIVKQPINSITNAVKVGQTHIKPTTLVNQQIRLQNANIVHQNQSTIPILTQQQSSTSTVTVPVNSSLQGANLNNININSQHNFNSNSTLATPNSTINKIVTIKAQSNQTIATKTASKKKQHFQNTPHIQNVDDKNLHMGASTSSFFQPSASMYGDDDINDVAAMGGVNLAEESQKILGSTENIGTQIRSCKDEVFLHLPTLQNKLKTTCNEKGLDEPSLDVSVLISHACQERLKNIVEKLAVIAEHRMDILKVDPRYEVTKDVRGQIKFLEELDKAEQKRHEEQEREILLRAAKSRSRLEDPEQAKLKAKAKEMQRAEMEELRQRDANMTALQAIGPRKKPKLENESNPLISSTNVGNTGNNNVSSASTSRPRIKRVNLKDLLFLMEQEKDLSRSETLYKAYLK